jgi:hypothetical protein
MTRFLHWRKMTWAIVLFNGAALAWLFVAVFFSGAAAACVNDSAGVALNTITQRECVAASGGGIGIEAVFGGVFWLLANVALGVIWFSSRPLWRQGHGARFRRLRAVPRPLRQQP